MRHTAAAALALCASLPAAACPVAAQDGQRIESGAVTLAWRAVPQPIKVGAPFVLLLRLCPADAQLVALDATMPEHRHGMNYKPSLSAQGQGRWRAEGLLWHMSGRWQLRFEVLQAGTRQALTHDVTLP